MPTDAKPESTAADESTEELVVEEESKPTEPESKPVEEKAPADPQPLPVETVAQESSAPKPVETPKQEETTDKQPDYSVVRSTLISNSNVPQALIPLLPADLVALAEYLNSDDFKSVAASISKPVAPVGKKAEEPEVKVTKPTGPDLASIGRALFGA